VAWVVPFSFLLQVSTEGVLSRPRSRLFSFLPIPIPLWRILFSATSESPESLSVSLRSVPRISLSPLPTPRSCFSSTNKQSFSIHAPHRSFSRATVHDAVFRTWEAELASGSRHEPRSYCTQLTGMIGFFSSRALNSLPISRFNGRIRVPPSYGYDTVRIVFPPPPTDALFPSHSCDWQYSFGCWNRPMFFWGRTDPPHFQPRRSPFFSLKS